MTNSTREATDRPTETETPETVEDQPTRPAGAESAITADRAGDRTEAEGPGSHLDLHRADPDGRAVHLVLVGGSLHARTPTQARLHALVVPIAPRISGQVDDVHVTNNQRVAAGDSVVPGSTRISYELIVGSSARPIFSRLVRAVGASEANVAAAEASLKAAEAGKTQAEQDAVRMRGIRAEDPGAISERRIQYAEAALAAAIANVEAAEANSEKARQDLGQLGENNVRILQAQVAIADAKLNIDRSLVRAPDDGVVTNVRLDEGNFAGSGQAQMTFITTDNLWVQADFTEKQPRARCSRQQGPDSLRRPPGKTFRGDRARHGFRCRRRHSTPGELPTIETTRTGCERPNDFRCWWISRQNTPGSSACGSAHRLRSPSSPASGRY